MFIYNAFAKIVAGFFIICTAISASVDIKVTKPVKKCQYKAKNGDNVSVHYTGKLSNGKEFDSSFNRGVPIEFELGSGMVIPGWEQGILGMCIGEQRTLNIPAELGYGSRAIGPIPANSDLVFDVELVGVENVTIDKDEL
ncbi:hypothetical protein OXX69_002068 [Metschnikowia pulcherrima]